MNPRHSLFASLLLACLGTAVAAGFDSEFGGGEAPRDERPPNIVYILADDLGYGEVGAYGQEKIRTPHLDRLAAEGMQFTQHYSGSPVCAPSRCVLLTGLHTGHAIVRDNWENGGWAEGDPEGQFPLPSETITVAELLRERGYTNGAFGKWGLGGPGSSGHPLRQGFDTFLGYLCQRQAHNYYPTHLWKDEERLPLEGNEWFDSHQKIAEPLESEGEYFERFAGETYATDPMIEGALGFIDENRDAPFFLYYASPVPHAALQVPEEELEPYQGAFEETAYLGEKGYLPHPTPRAAYAAMVSRFDANIGRLLARLDDHDLAESTIVLFSSDNGPTFNGGTDSTFFESAAGMRGLKCSVYEGGLRVPFLVRWPGRVAAGSQSDHLSGFQDVLPTLIELAGGDFAGPCDGLSLVPTLLGRSEQREHELLYWEYAGQQAIRHGPWKGVRSRLRRGELALQVFHLADDPDESEDLAESRPEVRALLEDLLEREHVPSVIFPLASVDPEPQPVNESTAAVVDEVTTEAQEHTGWIDLIGEDIETHWRQVNCAQETFSLIPDPVERGSLMIRCTGLPTGVLRTREMYENFVVEFDWRHLTKGWGANAGFFLWSDPLPALGVPFTRSVEVQVANFDANSNWYTRHGDVFPIHGAVMTPDPRFGRWAGGARSLPLEFRARGTGEWNHYRITCIDGTVQLELNGRLVSGGYHASPRMGYLCIESEGGEVHFRGLRILPLLSAERVLTPEEIATPIDDDVTTHPLYDGSSLEAWSSIVPGAFESRDWVLAGVKPGTLTRELPLGDLELRLDWRVAKEGSGPLPEYLPFDLGAGRVAFGCNPAGEWNRLIARRAGKNWTLEVNGVALPNPVATKDRLALIVESRAVDFASVLILQ